MKEYRPIVLLRVYALNYTSFVYDTANFDEHVSCKDYVMIQPTVCRNVWKQRIDIIPII